MIIFMYYLTLEWDNSSCPPSVMQKRRSITLSWQLAMLKLVLAPCDGNIMELKGYLQRKNEDICRCLILYRNELIP